MPTLSTLLRLGLLPFVLMGAMSGCGESEENGPRNKDTLALVDSTTFVTYHPILDANVRGGDSMLSDLTALIEEGIIVEADMPIIGAYVRSRGGIERSDSTFKDVTYRQLLNRALTQDMSGGVAPCQGCNDSIVIFIPGYSKRIFIGMGRRSLQEMIREGLRETEGASSDYDEPPMNQPIDSANWQEVIRTSMHGRDDIDWILFGNTMILLTRDGKKPSDYTYGHILAVVDDVRDMDEFEHVRELFERTKTPQTIP